MLKAESSKKYELKIKGKEDKAKEAVPGDYFRHTKSLLFLLGE